MIIMKKNKGYLYKKNIRMGCARMNKRSETHRRQGRQSTRRQSSVGYVYTLEVLIAVSIILISLVFVFRNPPTKPELEISLMKRQGFEALDYMMQKNGMRELVQNGNESLLEAGLTESLTAVQFDIDICNYACAETNVPANQTAVALDYYVSGYRDSYFGKKVRLWLWKRI